MYLERRIKEKRVETGYTQEGLGKVIGVSKVSVCQWEKGIKKPSTENLIKLANAFKVSIEYLIGNDVNVIDRISQQTLKMADNEIEIIKELRKHSKLYNMIIDSPKRAIELIDKKMF